jgi:hypothetical protein
MSQPSPVIGKYYFFVDGQKMHPNDYCSREEVVAALKIALAQQKAVATDPGLYDHTKRILDEFEALGENEK